MPSGLGSLGRWLLISLVALGLSLSGAAHHSVCHTEEGDHGCCSHECEPESTDAFELEEEEHDCALCFLGIDLPPEPMVFFHAPLGVERVSMPCIDEEPWTSVPLTESERGPPVAVQA